MGPIPTAGGGGGSLRVGFNSERGFGVRDRRDELGHEGKPNIPTRRHEQTQTSRRSNWYPSPALGPRAERCVGQVLMTVQKRSIFCTLAPNKGILINEISIRLRAAKHRKLDS